MKAIFTSVSVGPCHLHNQAQIGTGHTTCITEPPGQYSTSHHCLCCTLKAAISYSKVSVMNRCMGQLWDLQSTPLWPTPPWGEFETKAINTATHPPMLWFRYFNSIDPDIQFTQETPNTDGSIPFLDTVVSPGPDNTLHTSVYRKSSHTYQYIHWDSYCILSAKYRVFNSLTHRARTVCASTKLLLKQVAKRGP